MSLGGEILGEESCVRAVSVPILLERFLSGGDSGIEVLGLDSLTYDANGEVVDISSLLLGELGGDTVLILFGLMIRNQ